MGEKLIKSRSVLDLASFEKDRSRLTFEPGKDGSRLTLEPDGNDEAVSQKTTVTIPAEKWKDFGRPTAITVTIEPNDLLNLVGETE